MPQPTPLPTNLSASLHAEGYAMLTLPFEVGSAIANALEAGFQFFRSDIEEKLGTILPEGCGYVPLGIEYSQSQDRPDPIESFTASARTIEAANRLNSAKARSLYQSLLLVFEIFEPIAEAIAIDLASTLGIDREKELAGAFRRWSCIQMNYSRPLAATTRLIHETHEDGHFVTIGCSTAPGLEVQVGDGTFVPVSTSATRLVLMPGRLAYLLSGGYVRPLFHRVISDPKCEERIALLFFADVAPLACEPWVKNTVNAGVDIGATVMTNAARFGITGFSAE